LKVKKLKDLFSQFNESLISAGIEAIYIYGSQAHSIESTKEIPIGKEVDLVLVKKGVLKDGYPPISNELAKQIFNLDENIVFSFNGVWGNVKFLPNKYYFDLLGDGTENIRNGHPSSKIISFKKTLLIWGKAFDQISHKQKLSQSDKIKLLNIMSEYVKREFFKEDNAENIKSIYKNCIFIVSLYDANIIEKSSREEQIQEILNSDRIPKKIKSMISDLLIAYKNLDHKEICKLFLLIERKVCFEKI